MKNVCGTHAALSSLTVHALWGRLQPLGLERYTYDAYLAYIWCNVWGYPWIFVIAMSRCALDRERGTGEERAERGCQGGGQECEYWVDIPILSRHIVYMSNLWIYFVANRLNISHLFYLSRCGVRTRLCFLFFLLLGGRMGMIFHRFVLLGLSC